jgi:hypothetical protein
VSPSLPYHIAAVLLAIFAVGHTLGFRRVDPRWDADAVVRSMETVRFPVQGFRRTYWDLYVGFGLFVTILLLFSAILAWELGRTSPELVRALPLVRWTFAVAYAGVTLLNWRYFFIAPIVFSTLITLCLFVGAWLSRA